MLPLIAAMLFADKMPPLRLPALRGAQRRYAALLPLPLRRLRLRLCRGATLFRRHASRHARDVYARADYVSPLFAAAQEVI